MSLMGKHSSSYHKAFTIFAIRCQLGRQERNGRVWRDLAIFNHWVGRFVLKNYGNTGFHCTVGISLSFFKFPQNFSKFSNFLEKYTLPFPSSFSNYQNGGEICGIFEHNSCKWWVLIDFFSFLTWAKFMEHDHCTWSSFFQYKNSTFFLSSCTYEKMR